MGFVHTSDDAQRRLHANARRACQAEPKFADCGVIYRGLWPVPGDHLVVGYMRIVTS